MSSLQNKAIYQILKYAKLWKSLTITEKNLLVSGNYLNKVKQ